MKNIIEKISIPLFYGYTLLFQPLWGYFAARWLTRRRVLCKRTLLGWVVGLATLAAVFLIGWLGIVFRLWLSHRWYGDCPVCYEYTGLSYLIHDGSAGLGLIIFLLTAFRITRQNR